MTGSLVVASDTVDTGFDQNQAELGVLVVAVALQVLADRNSLLDQVVEILRNLGGETLLLQDTEDLLTSDGLDLTNTMSITENDTNLRGRQTLTREIDDWKKTKELT